MATTRAACLYCGRTLPPELRPSDEPSPPPPDEWSGTPASRRVLLVVEAAGHTDEGLAAALDLPLFAARQRLGRGGWQVHRLVVERDAEAALAALERAGVRALAVPEEEARVRPRVALGGRREEGGLSLQTPEGSLRLADGETQLVVRGPIVREYQPPADVGRNQIKLPRTATLDMGYRIHLHPRTDPRPVELDPAAFSFPSDPGSSLLQLLEWVAEAAAGAPVDDGFRREPPALAPAGPPARGDAAAGLFARSGRGRSGGPPQVLDNLEQFRFYSAWRAAVARRLAAPGLPTAPA